MISGSDKWIAQRMSRGGHLEKNKTSAKEDLMALALQTKPHTNS